MRLPVPLLAAAVGVVALASTAVATTPSGHDARTLPTAVGASRASAVRTSVVCPDLRILPGTLGTTVAVGTGTPGDGSVMLQPAQGDKPGPKNPVLGPGQTIGRYSGPLTGPITLSAQGALSGSLVAEQISRGNKTTDRGWSEARCEPPRAQQWFVGAATTPGDTPTLELANPTDTSAVVDVTVLTPSGVQTSSAGNNITVAKRSVQRLALSSLAPNVTVTAVRVTTSTGRVSAAVRDVRTSGETLLGTDWVPVGSAAASLTVAGLPNEVIGAIPKRTLFVGVPGDIDATVQVTVTDASGTYVPVGLDAVAVGAGTVRAIDLTKALGRKAAAVTVTSSDPAVRLVAGALIDAASSKGQPIHEIAYLGTASPLRGAAIVPVVRTAGDVDSALVVSAPRGQASFTLVISPPTGAESRQRITVRAGTTYITSLRARRVPDNSTVTIVPDPGTAPLYAARLIEENGALGPLLSSFTLLGAPPSQQVPAVAALPVTGG